ncbi:MAG: tetratricopeptide repeat protein [Myxococcota bacterium]
MRRWIDPGMTCPDENTLGELARGELDAGTRVQIEAHLDQCEACSDVVAELARIFASSFSNEIPDESLPGSEPDPSFDGMESTRADGDRPDRGWSAALPLPEGAKLGRYVVLRVIGAGAMGIVYAAFDPELDRKVAVKLLRRVVGEPSVDSGQDQSSRNKRMLREAQALARLTHPHAITVHDVGTWEGQVFLAMEFVTGGTLTAWLRASQPRPWPEVLKVFRQAGEGLAAAHDAGLVHRDFKPDNVLLHGSGRAVVTDFGLARPLGRDDPGVTDAGAQDSGAGHLSGSLSALSETLTQTGALVGTPAYMAPEQLAGRRSDAQSDQFAFCVALYEGLYGERPFRARSIAGLVSVIDEGSIPPPPRGRDVPRWLRRAVLRGLRVRPAERYPDMRSLLAALRPKRLGTWRSVAAMGVMSLAAGAGAVVVLQPTAAEPAAYCDDVESRLAVAWDDTTRRAIQQAFSSSGLAFADDVAARVIARLDDYAREWVEVQADACRSEVEGREPEAIVDVRMTCLAQRRGALAAMSRALSEADADSVLQSIEAVQTLPRPSQCMDVSELGRRLPSVPEAEREGVDQARSLLAESSALRTLGKVQAARDKAVEADVAAGVTRYGPVQAEAKAALAATLHEAGEIEEAERAMHEALAAGVAHDHDRIVAEAAASLAHLEITRMGPPVVIERWVSLGSAALDSLGGHHANLRANLAASLGDAQRQAGDLEAAQATLHEVLAIREEHFGPDHYSLAEPLGGLGMAYARAGDHQQSVQYIERARSILLATYGEQHPNYSVTLQNLATTHFVHGYYAEALRLYRESYRLFVEGLGAEHPSTAVLAYNVATTLAFMEQYDEALTYVTRAQAVEDQIHGARSRIAAVSWSLVAEIHLRAGRLEPAERAVRRAIEILGEVAPDDAVRRANYEGQLAYVLLLGGERLDEAQALLVGALEVLRKSSGEPSVEVAETSGRLAMVYLAMGRIAEARQSIDASVEQSLAADPDPHQHAEAWFRRAQVQDAAGERAAARAEAERAAALYAERADQPSRLQAVEDWLVEHPG